MRVPGKVNLYLAVGDRRADGYHSLTTVFHAVSLVDEVTVRGADELTLEITGEGAETLPTDEHNLAWRAAVLLAEHVGRRPDVAISIDKSIPVAGGMAGGSADAAGVLVALNTLWELGVPRHDLHALATRLGSDVPFALHGGTALGTGRGEELATVLARTTFHWVLAFSEEGLDKPEVYRELDLHRDRYRADIVPAVSTPEVDARVLQALRAGDATLLAEVLHNDLQAAALQMQPRIAGTLELGERAGALAGVVASSGPSCAFLCADLDSALELQLALSAAKLTTVKVTAPVPGARLID